MRAAAVDEADGNAARVGRRRGGAGPRVAPSLPVVARSPRGFPGTAAEGGAGESAVADGEGDSAGRVVSPVPLVAGVLGWGLGRLGIPGLEGAGGLAGTMGV